jgi:dolichyl-phosphate-mannose-protein mannosyltransferase
MITARPYDGEVANPGTSPSIRQLPAAAGGWRGWSGPLLVTALAAFLRLRNLDRPNDVVFDETYYAKNALGLLTSGSEQEAVENANDMLIASTQDWRLLELFTGDPQFVVHPPLGKWVIASGELVFGANPFGWRIAVALLGVLSVLLTARIIRRLSGSNLIGTLGGLLLAVDGLHIVMSRTALLDLIAGFWVLVAFGLLIIDRDHVRKRLAAIWESGGANSLATKWGPSFGFRPLRLLAGIALGLAIGTKWSGLWYLAAFGLLTVYWDVSARRDIGVHRPWLATLRMDAPIAFLSMVGVAAITYVLTWSGWIFGTSGWGRDWAATQPDSVLPQWLASLIEYHRQQLAFHTGLTEDHPYASAAWTWPLQIRPVSFYYENPTGCGAEKCSMTVLGLGNPIIWWAAVLALLAQTWQWIARRDWRAAAIVIGFLAGWMPWLLFPERTTFAFYSVIFLPFMVMALALSLGHILGPTDASDKRRRIGRVVVATFIVIVLAVSAWMLPIWTAETLTYEQWRARVIFGSWI